MNDQVIAFLELAKCLGCDATGFGVVKKDGYCTMCQALRRKGKQTRNERKADIKEAMEGATAEEKRKMRRLAAVKPELARQITREVAEKKRSLRERRAKLLAEGGNASDLSSISSSSSSASEDEEDDKKDESSSSSSSSSSSKSSSKSSVKSAPKESAMTEAQKKLAALKAKLKEARKETKAAVKEESERQNNPVMTESEWRRKERAEEEKRLNEELAKKSMDAATVKLLSVTAQTQDFLREKERRKEEAKAARNESGHGIEAEYRSYEKRSSKINANPLLLEGASTVRVDDDFSTSSHIGKGAAEKMASEKRDRESANKKKRSRVDGHYDEKDVTYINDANANFNKMLSKKMDKYTVEIRQNLERGTAL